MFKKSNSMISSPKNLLLMDPGESKSVSQSRVAQSNLSLPKIKKKKSPKFNHPYYNFDDSSDAHSLFNRFPAKSIQALSIKISVKPKQLNFSYNDKAPSPRQSVSLPSIQSLIPSPYNQKLDHLTQQQSKLISKYKKMKNQVIQNSRLLKKQEKENLKNDKKLKSIRLSQSLAKPIQTILVW